MADDEEKQGGEVYVFKCRDGRNIYETIHKPEDIKHYLELHNAIMALPAASDQSGKADSFR